MAFTAHHTTRSLPTFIGTDVTGTKDVGNADNGILVMGRQATLNMLGGTDPLDTPPPDAYTGKPSEGNVISGNHGNGVLVTNGAQHNILAGNFIGRDISGNADLGNTLDGVAIIEHSHNNSLLGAFFTTPRDERPFVFYNVVSGNDGNGLRIHDSNNTVIQANFFGMAADNGLPNTSQQRIGNELNGVLVEGSSANTKFGGAIPLGNVVAANGKHGIEVRDTASGFLSDNTFSGTGAFNNSTNFGNVMDGLHITSTGGNIVVQTSLFSANGDDGIEISGRARDVTIQQSIVGLNVTKLPGMSRVPNGDNGVEIGGDAHHNFIGLTDRQFSVAPQNTIGGNGNNGVAIIGNAHHNHVFGSFIGANLFGESPETAPVGNTNAGVFLGENSHHNMIGGMDDGDANVISGNGGHGVELSGATYHNHVFGNFIGTGRFGNNPPGSAAGNANAGVFLGGDSHHNTIGGMKDGDANVISGNGGHGIELRGATHDNRIIANLIGSDRHGNESVGNQGAGIYLGNGTHRNLIKDNLSRDNFGRRL